MAKSASSISSKASASASSLSKVAASSSSSLSSVAAKASASAASEINKQGLTGDNNTNYTSYAIGVGVFTAIVGVLVALHMSGQLDPLYKYIGKKYFKAAAKAEMLALQKTGSKEAEGFLKEKLKDNPAADLGDGDLDDLAKGGAIGDKLGKIGGGVGDKLKF